VKSLPNVESGSATKPPKGGFAFCSAGSSDFRKMGSAASASRVATACGSAPFSRSA
jgi:hypothetical protein